MGCTLGKRLLWLLPIKKRRAKRAWLMPMAWEGEEDEESDKTHSADTVCSTKGRGLDADRFSLTLLSLTLTQDTGSKGDQPWWWCQTTWPTAPTTTTASTWSRRRSGNVRDYWTRPGKNNSERSVPLSVILPTDTSSSRLTISHHPMSCCSLFPIPQTHLRSYHFLSN